jgi:hypothetical protein
MRAPAGPPAAGRPPPSPPVCPRRPPAGNCFRRCARAPATRPAGNSLALPQPPDIACGQRGKGGGPTACIAVGLARWLSASRRPAGAPAAASARAVRSLAVAGPPSGRGWRAARRRPANTRQTPSPRADRPCPAGPRVARLASRGARRARARAACARRRGCAAPGHTGGARGSLFSSPEHPPVPALPGADLLTPPRPVSLRASRAAAGGR